MHVPILLMLPKARYLWEYLAFSVVIVVYYMSKYCQLPIKIISIITLIALVFTQTALGYEKMGTVPNEPDGGGDCPHFSHIPGMGIEFYKISIATQNRIVNFIEKNADCRTEQRLPPV